MRVKICVFFVGLKLCQNMFSSNKKMVAWGLLMYVLHFIAVWLPRRPKYEIMLYGTIIPQAKGFENMHVKGRRWRVGQSGFRLICHFLEPAWYDIHNSHDRGCKSVAIKSRLAPVAINHHVTQQPLMTEKGNGHTNAFIGLHELEEIFILW